MTMNRTARRGRRSYQTTSKIGLGGGGDFTYPPKPRRRILVSPKADKLRACFMFCIAFETRSIVT